MDKIENIKVSLLGTGEHDGNSVCSRGDDYSLMRVRYSPDSPLFESLLYGGYRFDGIAIVLCTRGRMVFDLDLLPDTVEADTLTVIRPRTIVCHKPRSCTEPVEFYALLLSMDFLRTINIDINSINTRYFAGNRQHLAIDHAESLLLTQAFDLLRCYTTSYKDDDNYSGLIVRSHIASIFYQLMLFADRHIAVKTDDYTPRSRRVTYVQTFMSLVHLHHRRERSVAFYADSMCITPKYLSMVIKDTTGRSAGEWIDDFVINEAKNMLKFSDKNIQQIAYELNFANQSSFGKYFKHLTGMSPTQFQSS